MLHRALWRALKANIHVLFVLVVFGWVVSSFTPGASAAGDPGEGPGGPILIVTTTGNNFGTYHAEILRNEGLSNFTVADVGAITPAMLALYDVVILSKMGLTAGQVGALSTWVNGGGNLIAIAPDPQLSSLLGLSAAGTPLSNGYLRVDTSRAPGNGLIEQTMQYHGDAARYNLNGAIAVATLYSSSTTATAHPAVSLRAVGSGHAAAFTFDLAASIVQTRQGNPAWANQERDGYLPQRSNDKFYGASQNDPQPDWIDLTKVSIPQADEQQRLLANLIIHMNAAKKPLPRFWYFPRGEKAVIVMTGDDHGNGGTAERFNQFRAASPAGCSVADWECVRGTSYLYTSTPIGNSAAAQMAADGFEVGIHVSTGCDDFTLASLQQNYAQQIPQWSAKYSSLPAPVTQRHHCIAWTDWTSGAEVQLAHGIRLDTSYYFWPPSWVVNTPGFFNGSAMPMRFAKIDGPLVDVYLAPTHMTDESGQTFPYTVDTLLDRALGPEGYYGVYTVNAHTDLDDSHEADTVVASALARGVPVISAAQLLTWLDGRNDSSFGSLNWNGNALTFNITRSASANGLQAMLPLRSGGNKLLTGLTRSGATVGFTISTIKGIEYATFSGDTGSYIASYTTDTTAPTVTGVTPSAGSNDVATNAHPSATFSEAIDPSTLTSATFELRSSSNTPIPASVSYDPATRTARLVPSSVLVANATYTANLRGGGSDPRVKDAGGNPVAATVSWSFTTGSGSPEQNCPCGAFPPSAVPANHTESDPNPVELGVKFRSNIDGFITGIRFYKGTGNTGTHVGNLWTATGSLLASATFTSETASGWQQVNFSTPVAIAANAVYVASYFAPNGRYAADGNFFTTSGVDNPPIHLLRDGVSGGNGVYQYGASSSFPASSFRATNYWVDVVFSTSGTQVDRTPPTVVNVGPSAGAGGVSTGSAVTATFNEALNVASISTSTFELRHQATNALVASNVIYNPATLIATLTPGSSLAPATTYVATLRGGGVDPSVKDAAGNALASNQVWSFTTGSAGGPCAAPVNPIVAENCRTGNPPSEWDVEGSGDPSLQGFATQFSVNRGTSVSFKVSSTASSYRFDIYRIGYYGGLGARKIASVNPSATLPQNQPACLNQAATGLIDCGNWGVSGTWNIPADAVSGIYIAKLVRSDTGGASHIVFVVRDDASQSDLLFQTSDTTWQAYNDYGGNSLYKGSPAGRAYKVSYNRPFRTRDVDNGQDWLFHSEYPMIRWLEANGYHVSYFSGIDSDRYGSLIRNHKVFLSVGHDEYWSGTQRANVEAARDAGVNLAFFSGNEVYWKTRWENSIDGSGTTHRTLVSYKETHAGAKIDPTAAWTGTWRDPRFSPPSDGGRPENALTGTLFMVNAGASTALRVPEADGKMRLWRNTSVATQAQGATATLASQTVGYEWDVDADNGFRPPGLIRMSTTTVNNAPVLQDHGSTFASGTAVHSLTLYRHSSGARVFGSGTVQWSWGLDANHDNTSDPADPRMQQATVNLFADMYAQPATLQSGLSVAQASADTSRPTSTIGAPSTGTTIASGSTVTISGTATDSGGGVVGGVEVSVDGGTTWHRANGRSSWSYSWVASTVGSVTLRSRAVDDSGNIETPSAGVTVTVGANACPCTIWPASTTPATTASSDTGSVNLGVKFRTDVAGFISGIRFYKGSGNAGTHIGALWTSTGTQLATATFTSETTSGWQQVDFASPVPVSANTVYVASYLAPSGRYAINSGFFATGGVAAAPLHALQNNVSGGNGVYTYGSTLAFPSSTWQSANYWVDVVFTLNDSTPPTIASRSPAAGATGIATTSRVTVTFSEPMDASTINSSTIELRDASNAAVAAGVSYDAATRTATLAPSAPLAASASFTATVRGGGADPRVKDSAGSALAGTSNWTFTTGAPDTTAPTITGRSPSSGATNSSVASPVTVTFSESIDPTTIGATTFELRNASNALVSASVTYDVGSRTASLTPSSALTVSTTFTATVRGGASDPRVKDLAGNALAASSSWSFTTGASGCPCTIFPASSVPALLADSDTSGVTLGVKFRSDVNGFITGVRFYKSAANTGTHVATLWSSTGTQLASASFTGETSSGWQQVSFATPVAVTANTVYVASYHAPNGRYSSNSGYFAGSGVSNAPLHALQNGVSGGNGVYNYGSSPTFPSSTWQSANYWVDVVFTP